MFCPENPLNSTNSTRELKSPDEYILGLWCLGMPHKIIGIGILLGFKPYAVNSFNILPYKNLNDCCKKAVSRCLRFHLRFLSIFQISAVHQCNHDGLVLAVKFDFLFSWAGIRGSKLHALHNVTVTLHYWWLYLGFWPFAQQSIRNRKYLCVRFTKIMWISWVFVIKFSVIYKDALCRQFINMHLYISLDAY